MDLADGSTPDPSAPIDEIDGRPVLVAERIPVGVVVVEQVREVEPPLSDLGLDRRPHVLRRELRRVDAHDRETPISITPYHAPDPGDRSDAVDSTEGPDVQQDDMAAE